MQRIRYEFQVVSGETRTQLFLDQHGITKDLIETDAKREAINTIQNELSAYQEEGYEFINISINATSNMHVTGEWMNPEDGIVYPVYTLVVDVIAEFESNKPVAGSPIAPIILAFLIKLASLVITGIVVYYVSTAAIQAVGDWLQSMTTSRRTVKVYDEAGNLIEEIIDENPSPPGMGIAGVVAVIFLIIILFWFFGGPKRGGK